MLYGERNNYCELIYLIPFTFYVGQRKCWLQKSVFMTISSSSVHTAEAILITLAPNMCFELL